MTRSFYNTGLMGSGNTLHMFEKLNKEKIAGLFWGGGSTKTGEIILSICS